MPRNKVVVTGVGCITPFGLGVGPLRDALLRGESALRQISGFDTKGLRCTVAGEVLDSWLDAAPFDAKLERCLAMAYVAASAAMRDAALEGIGQAIPMVIGTAAGEVRAFEGFFEGSAPPTAVVSAGTHLASRLSGELQLTGSQLVLTEGCVAGAAAIGACADLIRLGQAEVALAGGADVISASVLAGFDALHALTPDVCRPFDEHRSGTQLSEGSAFFVLESEGHAAKRGKIRCEVLGYGISSDAFHLTRSDPNGHGPALAITRALSDANVKPEEIDYVSAHATATFQNDRIELISLLGALGRVAERIPTSSVKSQIGHSSGASGAIEAVACLVALEEQFLPATINLNTPLSEFANFDFVRQPGRTHRIRRVLKNSFGFGGMNVALVFGEANSGRSLG